MNNSLLILCSAYILQSDHVYETLLTFVRSDVVCMVYMVYMVIWCLIWVCVLINQEVKFIITEYYHLTESFI